MRRAVVLVAGLVLGVTTPFATPAKGAEKGPSAAELKRVQEKANRAAAAMGRAESSLARAVDGIVELESRATQTRTKLSALEGQVRQMAIRQYLRSGAPESWMGEGDLTNRVRGQALLRSVTQQQADAIDGYRATRAELDETKEALGDQLAARRKAVAELRKERSRISAELARLTAAQKAYEARVAAEKAAAAKAAAAKARSSRKAVSPPPAKAVSAGVARVLGSGDWICPVQGARAFSNDWGQPRSGGRRHQGNDIFASRGTPVVASVAGTVKGHNSSLGGISYYLSGADGNTYFGTHLDRLSGASGRVEAGTVVGYVGSSGNASASSTHLHFEIHPGGGGAVNPYPTLSRFC